jgi:hypothetical protein
MNLDEIVAREIEGVKARLCQYCKPGEHVVAFIKIIRSPSEPLTNAEWDAILSAEDWKYNHRKALEWIREYGFYKVRSRAIDDFWLSEYVTINNHLKKHKLPYRLKSIQGVNQMTRR